MAMEPAEFVGSMACDGCGKRAWINGRWIDGIDEKSGWVDPDIWTTLTKDEQQYFFEAVKVMRAEKAQKAEEEKERDAANYDKMTECKEDYEALEDARLTAVQDMAMQEDMAMEEAIESYKDVAGCMEEAADLYKEASTSLAKLCALASECKIRYLDSANTAHRKQQNMATAIVSCQKLIKHMQEKNVKLTEKGRLQDERMVQMQLQINEIWEGMQDALQKGVFNEGTIKMQIKINEGSK